MGFQDEFDSAEANAPALDEELTYSVLALRARRKLLVALAHGGPQTGAELMHSGRGFGNCNSRPRFIDSTVKNLKLMIDAGLVVQMNNENDGRRTLYSLSPKVCVERTADQTVFYFGFCVVRLSADGD